jgi:AcrR family transcriptional regulator
LAHPAIPETAAAGEGGYVVDVTDTTRQRLLEAAIEVIEVGGEGALRVRDIAAKANVTEPSIYHFFGDRNGLIEQAQAVRFGRGQTDALESFVTGVRSCGTKAEFIKLVRTALTASFNTSSAGRRFARVNVLGSAQSRPELVKHLAGQQRDLNRLLGDALRDAQERGFMRSNVDCDIFAVWVIGMTTGRLFIEIDPELAESQEWNALAIDSVLAAMGHAPLSFTKWNTPTRR